MRDKLRKGDHVTFRHEVTNAPTMLVKEEVRMTFRSSIDDISDTHLIGIKCFWFTSDFKYQEGIFHTKDLKKVGDEDI